MKKLTSTLILLLVFINTYSQDDRSNKIKSSFSIDGAVCLTTDGKAAYFNMGGAQIKFDVNHKVVFAITLLPSIGINTIKTTDGYTEKTRLNAIPFLGIGPQIFIKKFIFSFPFFYKNSSNVWVATAGIGYKIQYSKTK